MRPTRYRARWVLPIAGPPIGDGALLVDGQGRIAEVGADADVARPDDAESIELGVAALLPGLVNAHAHPELTALRGILEDLPFETWIPTLRDVKARAMLSVDDLQRAALWQLAEAYAAGITTVAATEDSSAALDALRASGGRGVVYREVFGPAPEQCTASMAGLKANIEELRARASDLVTIGVSPHAAYTVSDVLFRTVAEYAHAEGLPVAVHVAESAAESALVIKAAGPFAARLQRRGIAIEPRARSPIAMLEQAGILALRPLLIHCVQIDAADIDAIAAAGASVVHCPVANARLGHGIAPVVELHTAGVNVALGSDSMASNNRMDLLEEARIAQLMQRARLGAHAALPADVLLRMATLDGARALGLERVIGTLEPGKSADLCAVALDTVHARPVHDIHAAVIHAARASDVVLTAVQGRILYRNGGHVTIDVPALAGDIDALAGRVAAARSAAP